MKEASRKSEPGKPGTVGRIEQSVSAMPRNANIRSDLLVTRQRRATHRRIPAGTPVSRRQHKLPTRPGPHILQRIQKARIMPVLPAAKATATSTRKLARTEMRPAPLR